MAKSQRIRRFPVISERIENWKLKKYKGTLQNSHDFEEITFAITLLAGLLAVLWKFIEYFNNNAIDMNNIIQIIVYIVVGLLLFEFLLIFSFFLLKGYLFINNNGNENLIKLSKRLFDFIFRYPIYLSILYIMLFFTDFLLKKSNPTITILYLIVVVVVVCIYIFRTDRFKFIKNINYNSPIPFEKKVGFLIIIPIIMYFAINLVIVAPSILLMGSYSIEEFQPERSPPMFLTIHLLMGSYSIEEFQQSIKDDILTITIKETGPTLSRNYITLFKLNAEKNSLNETDNITLPINLESKRKSMFGGFHQTGIWYLNINTSNLQPGNYILHAEVTNDLSNITGLGIFRKHADKLFYIEPNSTKGFFNSTQEINNSSYSSTSYNNSIKSNN